MVRRRPRSVSFECKARAEALTTVRVDVRQVQSLSDFGWRGLAQVADLLALAFYSDVEPWQAVAGGVTPAAAPTPAPVPPSASTGGDAAASSRGTASTSGNEGVQSRGRMGTAVGGAAGTSAGGGGSGGGSRGSPNAAAAPVPQPAASTSRGGSSGRHTTSYLLTSSHGSTSGADSGSSGVPGSSGAAADGAEWDASDPRSRLGAWMFGWASLVSLLLQHVVFGARHVTLLAEVDDRVVGCAGCTIDVSPPDVAEACGEGQLAPGADYGLLTGLAVAPAWRRRGVASALLAAAAEVAAVQLRGGAGAALLGLLVARTNVAAIRLYERAGFVHQTAWEDARWRAEAERGKVGKPRRLLMMKWLGPSTAGTASTGEG